MQLWRSIVIKISLSMRFNLYLDEVRLFQNAMALSDPEKETLMAEIIRKTGRACFGL